MRILIVEDEKPLARLLEAAIKRGGHNCEIVHRGDAALDLAKTEAFDAIVLDLSLPGMDGLEVLKNLRDSKIITPVLVLTARGDLAERIEGLYSGADDYLAKPCDLDEVVARVHALVRRAGARHGKFTVGKLTLDPLSRTATRDGKRLDLTSREFLMLEMLARSVGTPLSRVQILERVFGYRVLPETNIVEVHIKNLRQKVDRDFDKTLIKTITRVGYIIREEDTV